jgi:hypothetical protein
MKNCEPSKDVEPASGDTTPALPQPYTYENGTPSKPPAKPGEPFIPDRGFDDPA